MKLMRIRALVNPSRSRRLDAQDSEEEHGTRGVRKRLGPSKMKLLGRFHEAVFGLHLALSRASRGKPH